jgi:hypothetical protein
MSKPDDIEETRNECTNDDIDKINPALMGAYKRMVKSKDNYDETAFRRWFGKDNNQ